MQIEVAELTVRYGKRAVLDGLSLEVRSRELLALLGPSGSGKSTLLAAIAGLLRPDAGEVRFDGAPAPRRPRERAVGMVFQDLALWPHMSVEQHLRFVAPRRDPAPVLEALEIAHLRRARPATLSGGEAQRLAIARALAARPRAFLLDEPTGPLDRRLKGVLLELVRSVHREFGTTTLLVTHDHAEAFRVADRVAVLLGGRVRQIGAPSELYRRPATAEVAELTGPVSFLSGEADGAGRVRTRLGTHALAAAAMSRGTVRVVVRPEDARVEPEAGSDAFVAACLDTGGAFELDVRAGAERVSVRSEAPIAEGTPVRLELAEPLWAVS